MDAVATVVLLVLIRAAFDPGPVERHYAGPLPHPVSPDGVP